MTMLIYVDTSRQVRDKGHIKCSQSGGRGTWLEENAPEDVAFAYELLE